MNQSRDEVIFLQRYVCAVHESLRFPPRGGFDHVMRRYIDDSISIRLTFDCRSTCSPEKERSTSVFGLCWRDPRYSKSNRHRDDTDASEYHSWQYQGRI